MMLPLSAPFAKGFRRLVGNRAILFGIIILAVVVLTSLLAPLITPYSPAKLSIANRPKPPSGAHLFGTDEFGRDIFTRAVFAGLVSLLVGLASSASRRCWASSSVFLPATSAGWTRRYRGFSTR
ncbi:hypothetical protein [Paracoccus sphaerophysae]|uniref:hypothetical protein n=1 Tax=Paracoccus sphaerophysae TaxID=690417 RepID=UPI000B1B6062|nr:hypothetical protein [Paracoccus sphaerophysae]